MTYEQNLMKDVNQKEEEIDDPENSTANNVIKHVAIVGAFVTLVKEKIAAYRSTFEKLYGDINDMENVVND